MSAKLWEVRENISGRVQKIQPGKAKYFSLYAHKLIKNNLNKNLYIPKIFDQENVFDFNKIRPIFIFSIEILYWTF